MQLFVIHQEAQRGGGEWTERRELRSQTSGEAPISSDTTRGVMDGSCASFGGTAVGVEASVGSPAGI